MHDEIYGVRATSSDSAIQRFLNPVTSSTRRLFAVALIGFFALMSLPASAAPPYSDVAAGNVHACALGVDQSVECEAVNFARRLLPPPDIGFFTALAAGEAHTCGINTGGAVVCWGDNDFGQLDVPELILPVSAIDGGQHHTCAIDASGAVTCWGLDSNGRLDLPFTTGVYTAISTRNGYSCAIDDATQLSCSTSLPALSDVPMPPAVLNERGVVQVEAVSDILDIRAIACAIDTTGDLSCWTNTAQDRDFDNGPYVDVAISESFICAVQQSGSLECQLHRSTRNIDAVIASIPTSGSFVAVDGGPNDQMCAIDTDGEVLCWGLTSSTPPFAEDLVVLPAAPVQFTASVYSETTLELLWRPDFSVGVPSGQRYEIFRDGELLINTGNGSSFVDTVPEAGVDYEYRIRSVSTAGFVSEFTDSIIVNTGNTTGIGPGATYERPERSLETSGLRAEVYFENTVELFWNRELSGVRGYEIRKDGEFIGFTDGISFIDNTVNAGDKPDYDVVAVDTTGGILGFASLEVQIGVDQCLM